jgi:hypothetical protein
MARVTAMGAATRGLVAGVIGTAAMTAWQEVSTKLQSSDDDREGESQAPGFRDAWAKAPAPAKVGRKVLKAVFQYEVPAEQIGLLTNLMHWGYGTSWGAIYGLIRASVRGPSLVSGIWFGAGVWATSYATMVPLGIYEPPWQYPPKELALDLSYHLVYGAGVAAGYEVARAAWRET